MSGFSWPSVIGPLMGGHDLSRRDAHAAMAEIMSGEASPAQISAFIIALRAKGETVEELTGLVTAMREAAVQVTIDENVVDTAGTGGSGLGSFNISTIAAFVAAGAGARVAKHGNRAASSACGSADVLEALDIHLELSPADSARMVREVGFGFFFAPRYHPSMRHAGPVRRELGVRTVFNFLGPLANPAGATRQALGVSDPDMVELMAGALEALGSEHALVFHGSDGLDELTLTGPSDVYRLENGAITHTVVNPGDFGLPVVTPDEIAGGGVEENTEIVYQVLSGAPGPKRDIVVLNAAAAIVAAGLASDLGAGVEAANTSIDDGAALERLDAAVELSRELAG